MSQRIGLVLLSGGLDSTTVAAQAVARGFTLSAITIRYGQVHEREVESARQVAVALGIQHHVVDVDFYRDLAWYSALTQPGRFAIPRERPVDRMGEDIPITYVPMRNTFFITLGAALLESECLKAIEMDGVAPGDLTPVLFIAANAIDYSGYPDCRPEFYQAVSQTICLGSKLGTQYGVSIQIETPLIAKNKADIARLATEVGAPLRYTWSCYSGGERPCGVCDSCLLRAKGFAEAGLPDPALVAG